MKNTFGTNISITLFGESHGKAIGAVIDGLPAGISIDEEYITNQLELRKPYGSISTKRTEADKFEILSGVFNGKTTGTPVNIVIYNNNIKSEDYGELQYIPRPSHADYTSYEKYNGFGDYRGGGHFSGRITAALVASGAILKKALEQKGIFIGTHISKIGKVTDKSFNNFEQEINILNKKLFAVLDASKEVKMVEEITNAAEQNDSVGGILETAVIGMPVGVGEPWFDTVEGVLAHALFSVPAVKGVEFGAGFGFGEMNGSNANDEFKCLNGKIITTTNNNGGINGGITNGMPVVFKTALKPTPSISKQQNSVNLKTLENVKLSVKGRHDPCIVHRARVVIDSVVSLALCDLLITKFGTDWLVE